MIDRFRLLLLRYFEIEMCAKDTTSAVCGFYLAARLRLAMRLFKRSSSCTPSGKSHKPTVSASSYYHYLSKLILLGMTETAVAVCGPSEHDIYPRGSGSLLPGVNAKLIDAEGNEVTAHETPGELYIQGPMVVLGYLHNVRATAETFVHHEDGRWIRTGDEAVVAVSSKGNEHIVIVDRIKELIKVKVCGLCLSRERGAERTDCYRATKSLPRNWRRISCHTRS